MSLRRSAAWVLGAGCLTLGGLALAHGLASAAQSPVVVQRFLLGYFDRKGRFVPTAGRGATNVDRNAIVMFVFSGAVDQGPNRRATLPLTLAEQAELNAQIQADPDYDPRQDGIELGVIPRKRTEDRAAYYVASGSVNQDTVQITVPTGGGSADAKGQFFKFLRPGTSKPLANRLLFHPGYNAYVYNKPGEIDYNPVALEPGTVYSVFIDGGPNPQDNINLLRNTDGLPMEVPFQTSFTTGTRYVQDFTRPQIRETAPTDDAVNVVSDADIDLTFSEPMNISSFQLPKFQTDDAWTMRVRYNPDSVRNGSLAGRNVLGTVRVKPQTAGNVVQFRPLQGFGKGPYDIDVVVTNGVTDLSGNNIIRQFQLSFGTEFNPNAENFDEIVENFDTTTKRDSTFVPSGDYLAALWNPSSPASAKGLLSTVITETSFDIGTPSSGTGVNVWANFPIRVQQLYPASELQGRARTYSGFSWWNGVTVTGSSYPNTTIQIGHASDTVAAAGFPTAGGASNSHFGDTPVVVTPANTYTPGAPNGSFVRGPTWVKNFNYDGNRGVILDVSHNGNGTAATQDRWRINAAYAIQTSTVTIAGPPVTTQSNTWLYCTRFHFLTPGAEAQSLFYDIGINDARLQPQQLVPFTQPQGTSVVLVWQGAKEDPSNPGSIDPGSFSAWVSDIRQLSNHRFIRFRATLNGDLSTMTAPTIDSITIPYTYR